MAARQSFLGWRAACPGLLVLAFGQSSTAGSVAQESAHGRSSAAPSSGSRTQPNIGRNAFGCSVCDVISDCGAIRAAGRAISSGACIQSALPSGASSFLPCRYPQVDYPGPVSGHRMPCCSCGRLLGPLRSARDAALAPQANRRPKAC